MTDQIVVYPVVIKKDEQEPATYPYLVAIPILDGLTEGASIEDALKMAADYIGTYSLASEQLPDSTYQLPKTKAGEIVSLVRVNISEYRRKNDTRTVKKTLTIPNYLNELGRAQGLNFSALLTDALKETLHID